MIVESYEDVIVLSGALRQNFWETVHTAVSLILKRHPSGVIIDCSQITEITPKGADTFVDVFEFVEEHEEARIILAAVPAHVKQVLREIPEVRSQIPIVGSVEEARRSLDVLASQTEEKKDKTRDYDRDILAILEGHPEDQDVLAMAKELILSNKTKVTLLLPIIVPRELPLTAPLVDLEEKLVKTAEEGKKFIRAANAKAEMRLERSRDIASLMEEISEEIDADFVVAAITLSKSGHRGQDCYRTVESVFEKVKRPVVIVRGSIVK
jgi:anti-anti-sigma regulatory factor